MTQTQFVHYVGHAEHFTSKQKTDTMNNICNEMAADGLQLITVIPDVGGDGTTMGLWLFFAASSTEARTEVSQRSMLREPALQHETIS